MHETIFIETFMLVAVSPASSAVALFLVVLPLPFVSGPVLVSVFTLTAFGIVLPKTGVDFTVGECERSDSVAAGSLYLTNIF